LQREKRKLLAIVAADVVGYSNLIGRDEEGTLRALRAHRAELIDPLIENHGGRIANTAGDSVLVEFPSAVDAVRCSIAIQEGMAERNNDMDADRRICFRIGINVGDVIAEGDDLLGDAVNIAARLEGLCQSGSVLLSDDAYRQVRNRIESDFDRDGPKELKNIADPVTVWRWLAGEATVSSIAPTADARSPLPDKPSIAVLPFDNISSDPDQDYFADGMTEDLITDISKLSGLLVIGRNSSFVYKGKSVDLRQVGRELGVHYVLEGSVRKVGNRVRINAQLIDARSGHHVWAERHDGTLDDVFALQDEITGRIVSALSVQLLDGEKNRLTSQYTANSEAHDWFLRARIHYREPGPKANAEANGMLDRALAVDPGFAWALAIRSYVMFHAWFFKWNTEPDAFEKALADAERAVVLDPELAGAHSYLGWMHMWGEGHDRAVAEHEKALALDPHNSEGYFWYASTLIYSGRPELGIAPMERAMRLDPHFSPVFLINFGNMYLQLGRYAEAERYLRVIIEKAPDFPVSYIFLAAVLAAAEDKAGARRAGAEILERMPEATASGLGHQFPYAKPEHLARMVEGLRTAGLPE
jgi:adenylate cyclase